MDEKKVVSEVRELRGEVREAITDNLAVLRNMRDGRLDPAGYQHEQLRIKACNALYTGAVVFFRLAEGERRLEAIDVTPRKAIAADPGEPTRVERRDES